MTDRTTETALPVALSLDDAIDATTAQIRRLLKTAPVVIKKMTTHLARATGKMIRARALLACAVRSDGLINPDAVKAAAAVELLHLATLVHDDIIDDADTRRGIDALHKKFGEKYAVLCGDWLFCTALEFVATVAPLENRRDDLDRTFPRYLSAVCLGELRQNENNNNLKLSEREYFKIIRGKTAALFEASFYTGFLFSDEQADSADIYKEIGSAIGVIFQLADDCADYEATRQQIKKPVLYDYSRGVVTLPLIQAMKADETLMARVEAGIEPETLKEAIRAAGGLVYTHKKIVRLYKKAGRQIEALDIVSSKKDLLTRLLNRAAGVTVA